MSQMKFIRAAESCVEEMLSGLAKMYPSFHVDVENRIVYLNKVDNSVKILSGGGAGHEPFAAGYVGDGMLSAAVSGKIFASPPARCIFNAISTLALNNNNNGILVVVMNYTGDIINFGLAIEQAEAKGVNVQRIVVSEDCSKFGEVSKAGKRGMCGGVIIMKIAGAMAKMGEQLTKITETCSKVIENLASIGTCVTSCTVPGTRTLFQLPDDEMEFGIGIHGEAGVLRTKLVNVRELVQMMLGKIVKCINLSNKKEENVCVLINNLGSVSQLEMGIIANEVANSTVISNLTISRIYCGTLVTSLDMAGFQICLLKITKNEKWLQYLDYECKAPAWLSTTYNIRRNERSIRFFDFKEHAEEMKKGKRLDEKDAKILKNCLQQVAAVLRKNKYYINELDSKTGDGDTGTTLNYLAEGILENIHKFPVEYPASVLSKLTKLAELKMGGTLGGLLSIMFTSSARYFLTDVNGDWLNAYKISLHTAMKYSSATVGDRTMLDVLIPVYEQYEKLYSATKNHIDSFHNAASTARKNAEQTRTMKPKAGRASYVSQDIIEAEDPGAYAAAICIEAISTAVTET